VDCQRQCINLPRPGCLYGLGTCPCRQKGHDTQCPAPDFLQVVDQAVGIRYMRMGVCPLPSALDLLLNCGSPVAVGAWHRCGYTPSESESQSKDRGANEPLLQVRSPGPLAVSCHWLYLALCQRISLSSGSPRSSSRRLAS
jgi:hypothetical protein